jgi:hypothetical protein
MYFGSDDGQPEELNTDKDFDGRDSHDAEAAYSQKGEFRETRAAARRPAGADRGSVASKWRSHACTSASSIEFAAPSFGKE